MRIIKLIIIAAISLTALHAQEKKTYRVNALVTDGQGQVLPYVNVFFKDGDYAGALSNDSGKAAFQTVFGGERTLVASMIGYDAYEKKIQLPLAGIVKIILAEKSIELSEIQIEASAYTGGEGKVTLTKIDVYTTPGGAADVFQSIKVLPGVTQTDETAAIPVRGGSPSENLILLNGATLSHPYHGENASGNGLFSIVETAVIKKLYFSSGAFSVKYSNALSGVLDIETENRISKNKFSLNANLVGVDGGLQRVLNDKLSLQVFGRRTSTALLFKLNKPTFDVVEDPTSSNVTAILNYTYSPTGLIQWLGMTSGDAQAFDLTLQSNASRYRLQSNNQVSSLVWSDIIHNKWVTKSSFTYSAYQNTWTFGNWGRDNREYDAKARWDNNYNVSTKTVVNFGTEFYGDFYNLDFVLPKRRGEFYTGADSVHITGKDHALNVGSYAEWQHKIFNKWSASFGVRQDFHSLIGRPTFDIRGALVHELTENSFLRFAAGTFHQNPNIILFDKQTGNRDLKAMEAKHFVVGYEKNIDVMQFKLEAYYKMYSHLPLEDVAENYVSRGRGYARGVDVFLKGTMGRTTGWVSYGFIQTRRKELDIATVRPSIYDITHNLKVVTKNNLGKGFELSNTTRLATGRPFTPITGGAYDAVNQHWAPAYAQKNSGRFPTYVRVDARVSKYIFFGTQRWLVLYVEGLNVFGKDNILDYKYSEDFSQRSEIQSYFSNRTVVMGFALTL